MDQRFTLQIKADDGTTRTVGFTGLDACSVNSLVPGTSTASNSFIARGTTMDRIILKVDNFDSHEAADFKLWINHGRDKVPFDTMAVTHDVPYLKTWTSDNNNDSEGFILDPNMPQPDIVSGATNYYRFTRVNAKGEPWKESDTGKPHPNVYYIDFPSGVTLSEGMTPESILGGKKKTDVVNGQGTDDHLTFFNLTDEDGYDVGNPMQGGQWFFKNTWWAANPRVVSADAQQGSGDWKADMRYKFGTPGDLVVGEEMTCYGITIFRITGERYDMYAETDDKFGHGNIYYLYFNCDESKKGRAEMTAPIMLNMLGGNPLKVEEGVALQYYEPRDFMYPDYGPDGKAMQGNDGRRYFNVIDYGTNAGDTEAVQNKPIMLTCSSIDANGDAIYTLELDRWSPAATAGGAHRIAGANTPADGMFDTGTASSATGDAPFEFISVTGSLFWNAQFVSPEDDKLRPSKWSYYYLGKSQQGKRIDGEEGSGQNATAAEPNIHAGDGRGVVHGGRLWVNEPTMSYSRLVMATNGDNVRFMLQANVPTLDPGAVAKFTAHDEALKQEQYPALIYPEVRALVEVPVLKTDYGQDQKPIYVNVRINREGSDEPVIMFYKYTSVTFGEEDENGRGTVTATLTPVELEYRDGAIVIDEATGEPKLKEDTAEGESVQVTLPYHSEKANPDELLLEGQVIIEFEYLYSMNPAGASAQASVIENGIYNKNSSQPRTLDWDPTLNGVTITVKDNATAPSDKDGGKLQQFTTTYTYAPENAANTLPRQYEVYQYDTKNAALAPYLNEDGTVKPERYSDFIALEGVTKVTGEPGKENTETTHTGAGTAVETNVRGEDGDEMKKEVRVGYLVAMTYTFAVPADGGVIERSSNETYDYATLPEGYIEQKASAYDSDWGRYLHDPTTTGIDAVAASTLTVSTAPGTLRVDGVESCAVYTPAGALMYSGRATTIALPAGLYIVATPVGNVKALVP